MNPEALEVIANLSALASAGLVQAWKRNEVTDDDLVGLVQLAIEQGQARGIALADVAIAAAVGGAPAGFGADVLHERARALVAAGKIAAAGTEEAAKIETRAEVMDTSQRAAQRAMEHHGVENWTRRLNGTACALCRDLAGPVLPITTSIYTHKGCGCTQRPLEATEEA